MSQPQSPSSTDADMDVDADLAAIRTLIHEAGSTDHPTTSSAGEEPSAVVPEQRAEAQNTSFLPAVVRAKITTSPMHQEKPAPTGDQPATAAKQPSRLAAMTKQLFRWAWERIKTYRPERKRILVTSLVLLLILKPFFVIGWTAVFVMAVVICFAVMGADAFWRKVIDMYQGFARRWPAHARVLKLRSYVLARKWDRLLGYLPAGLADQMRPPDLRDVIAADARHSSAMQDRLQRMNKDDVVW